MGHHHKHPKHHKHWDEKPAAKAVKTAEAAKTTHGVVVQKWEESERGWGTRPDGYSLHLTEADRRKYGGEYWAQMPDDTPNAYSRPDGTAYIADVYGETYETIKQSKNGIRVFSGKYPGDGGADGWRAVPPAGHGKSR